MGQVQEQQITADTDGADGETAANVVPFVPGQNVAVVGRVERPARTADNASATALLRAIQRLEGVIDEEVVALRSRQPVDFDHFSRRKNRGLLELIRSSKAAGDGKREPAVADAIVRLRSKLETNYNVLRLHLEAVRAVSAVICRTIREAESDGTYPATAGRKESR